MNKEILFLIVVHNKSIIDVFESNNRYIKLKNYKYLLVGDPSENLNSKKIIQCNTLPNNIENESNYLAYTGWYAAAYNPFLLEDYEYICFLEYDTDVDFDFSLEYFTNTVFTRHLDCYGINLMDNINVLFERSPFTTKLIRFLIENNYHEIRPNNNNWIVTNNVVFKTKFLLDYFNDELTVSFLKYLKNDKMSGHFLERFLSVFCFIKNVQFDTVLNNKLTHRGYDSHNTQNIYSSSRGYEQFKAANQISN
jgi:hypothetical protein